MKYFVKHEKARYGFDGFTKAVQFAIVVKAKEVFDNSKNVVWINDLPIKVAKRK